jgi:hypothetical protein
VLPKGLPPPHMDVLICKYVLLELVAPTHHPTTCLPFLTLTGPLEIMPGSLTANELLVLTASLLVFESIDKVGVLIVVVELDKPPVRVLSGVKDQDDTPKP